MTKSLSRLLTAVAALAMCLGIGLGTARHTSAQSSAAPASANIHTLLVARTLDDMRTMDPDRMYEFSSEAAGINIFDPLLTFNGQNLTKPVGLIATSWKISRGGRLYTFNLRHNVHFSTGRLMTSKDVVFSLRRLGYLADNPSFLMGFSSKPSDVYKVEAVGPYQVKILLPAPDLSFLAQVSDANFAILDSVAARAHGAVDTPNAAKADKATNWLNEHSISTGPFMLQSWVRGAAGSITLVRNPYFWGPKTDINKIVFEGIESPATERLQVSRGTVDIAQSIDIDGIKALQGNSSVRIAHGNALDIVYMGMTLNPTISKPLANPLVRQAIRHAIDYNGIINGLLGGYGAQTNGMIPVGLLGNLPSTNNQLKPSYDPNLAKSLLTQAGYKNGFNVDLYYGAGHVVDGVSMDLLMPVVQHYLQAVGINATLKPEAFVPMLADYRAQKLPMVAIEWGVDYPDPGDFAGPFSPGGGPAKRMWYLPSVDSSIMNLVAQGTATTNKLARAGIYRQIENIWLKESAFAPLLQPQNLVVLHKGVKGYVMSPLYVQGNFRTVSK